MGKMMILKDAFAQQIRGEKWKVYDREGNQIWELPDPCNEHTAMSAIKLGRKYEEEAYQAGLEFGKDAMLAANRTVMTQQGAKIKELEERNEFLAEQLKRHIEKG